MSKKIKARHVVLGVTGSIAAYRSADILRGLTEAGHEASVIMTKEATEFISPLTFSGLLGKKVYSHLFEEGSRDGFMPHIHLAESADVLLIAPATANVIGKIANGLADDLLTCVALATRAPLIIAPAMNTGMYKNNFVQENCRKLKKAGARFVEPVSGKLACGTVGQGHIADEEAILKAVKQAAKA